VTVSSTNSSPSIGTIRSQPIDRDAEIVSLAVRYRRGSASQGPSRAGFAQATELASAPAIESQSCGAAFG
jgi:hypothetical protein